jgi:hypothetical protein
MNMTTREELRAALDLLEDAVERTGMLVVALRRLEQQLPPVESNPGPHDAGGAGG